MVNEEFEKCIQQMKEKDRSGLQRVYEEYNSYIYAILLSYVGGHEDAEDLTVEFFIHLWNKAGSYRPGSGHKAWITRMARNLAVDYLRKNRREVPSEAPEQQAGLAGQTVPSAEDTVVETLGFRDLIGTLSEEEKRIVTMKIRGELTFKEISSILEMPMGTVSWKYQEAAKKLRRAQG